MEFFLLFLGILFVFVIGLFGLFSVRKNLILILMSIELMLLSINLNFIMFSFILMILLVKFFRY
jgi:NADH-quinone oxidoreductase subunit K